MEKGVIYKITSPSGKIYIGQTKNFKQRKNCYKSNKNKGQTKLYNSISKYGWNNHNIEIIENIEHEIFYNEIANALEIYWIKFYDCVNSGLNIQEGGKNYSMSEETKEKLRIINTGKTESEETKNKISLALSGVPKTKEHIEKVRLKSLGRKQSNEQKKKNGLLKLGNTYRRGSVHSDESKDKMRIAKEGKIVGQHPKKWNDKIGRANSVKIVCENNGKIYDSLSIAANELGLTTSKISSVCKNKRSHTKGYKFNYV